MVPGSLPPLAAGAVDAYNVPLAHSTAATLGSEMIGNGLPLMISAICPLPSSAT